MRLTRFRPSIALAVAAGCMPDGGVVVDRVDSAGVAIVTNRGPDRPLHWRFTPRLTLGGKDEGPEAFYRVAEAGVAADGAGNIHVLDFDAFRVQVFDSAGRHVRTLGRQGGGPGELEFPTAMYVDHEGIVSVLDFAKSGAVRWAADGSLLDIGRIRATSPVMRVAFVDGGAVYARRSYDDARSVERTILQRERGDSLEELAAVERPVPGMLEFTRCAIRLRLPPLFSPEISWAEHGGRVVSASRPEYEISVRDADRFMLVRRDLAPLTASPEIAAREVGDSLRMSAGTTHCAVAAAEVVVARGFAATVPAVRGVAVAPDHSVWARRGGPRSDPAIIDVFARDGAYLGTLPPGSPVPIGFLPNGDLLVEQTDPSTEVEHLVVYRVDRSDDD